MSDSDTEVTELDIETRTWNKLEKNMKIIGFREGAAEGRNISFQEGLNFGFADGFKLGKKLGILKGRISIIKQKNQINAEKEKNQSFNMLDQDLGNILNEVCLVCCGDEKLKMLLLDENCVEILKKISMEQHTHCAEKLKTLENFCET